MDSAKTCVLLLEDPVTLTEEVRRLSMWTGKPGRGCKRSVPVKKPGMKKVPHLMVSSVRKPDAIKLDHFCHKKKVVYFLTV